MMGLEMCRKRMTKIASGKYSENAKTTLAD
jgi:hypothetical protein